MQRRSLPTLTRLCEEDMTLLWQNDHITHETVLQGMGDQHIDVAIHRAQVKFQVGLTTHEPRIPYRGGITRKASGQYRHKKQSGGAGQFGEVHLRIEPYHEGDFEFTDELVGMNLSKSYLPPIEKGIKATMERGAFAGYPMNNVKVIVYDGKEHEVDSKPVAFEIAGREAFKLAVQSAGPVLFEPIMEVHVTVPDANMGDVMSDLNTRRGRVQGTETERGSTTVIAHVPMAEMTSLHHANSLHHRRTRLLYDGIASLRCCPIEYRHNNHRSSQEGSGSQEGRIMRLISLFFSNPG